MWVVSEYANVYYIYVGIPMFFLDVGLKNMSEHCIYRMGSCSNVLCCGCFFLGEY